MDKLAYLVITLRDRAQRVVFFSGYFSGDLRQLQNRLRDEAKQTRREEHGCHNRKEQRKHRDLQVLAHPNLKLREI